MEAGVRGASEPGAGRIELRPLAAYAWLSVAAAVATIALKSLAYWLTGSVGLLSDALESLVNLAGAMFALLMSAMIAFETSAIIHGGERNYIMATVGLFVSLFNLFTSLLQLLGIAGSDE